MFHFFPGVSPLSLSLSLPLSHALSPPFLTEVCLDVSLLIGTTLLSRGFQTTQILLIFFFSLLRFSFKLPCSRFNRDSILDIVLVERNLLVSRGDLVVEKTHSPFSRCFSLLVHISSYTYSIHICIYLYIVTVTLICARRLRIERIFLTIVY